MGMRRFCFIVMIAAFAGMLGVLCTAQAAEKPVPTVYWMSVATQNQTIPGMPAGMPRGRFGMPGGGGPTRSLLLQMNSPMQIPAAPNELHDIPAGMNMGPSLPLVIPRQERAVREEYEQHEERFERERMRIKVYWGCGDTVRPGQPRIIDTSGMSPAQIGQAMRGWSLSRQTPPAPGRMRIYAQWPNEQKVIEVPSNASLVGQHFVHGNFSPDIRFAIDQAHDFLAPVEFTNVTGGLADSISFSWRMIPNSLGSFGMAMATTDEGGREMILWSSSESYGLGWQLIDYVSSPDVRRLVKDRVIMPSEQTSCKIPKGIFAAAQGAVLQFIAYGDDLHFGWPPKPKDPIWGVKVRSKSTGMLPLGMDMGSAGERRSQRSYDAPRDGNQPPPPPPPSSGYDSPPQQEQQEQRAAPPPPRGPGFGDVIRRGLFGF